MFAGARYAKHSLTLGGRVAGLTTFAAGLLASLAANMLASEPGLIARTVATWPAVTLLMVALTMELSGRKQSSPAEIARRRQLRMERRQARRGTWRPAGKVTGAHSHQDASRGERVPTGTPGVSTAPSNGHGRPEILATATV